MSLSLHQPNYILVMIFTEVSVVQFALGKVQPCAWRYYIGLQSRNPIVRELDELDGP